jgi:hypothetical protein
VATDNLTLQTPLRVCAWFSPGAQSADSCGRFILPDCRAKTLTESYTEYISARAIYLYLEDHAVLYLCLTLYTKKEQADLTPGQKKPSCAIVDEIKRAYRDRL